MGDRGEGEVYSGMEMEWNRAGGLDGNGRGTEGSRKGQAYTQADAQPCVLQNRQLLDTHTFFLLSTGSPWSASKSALGEFFTDVTAVSLEYNSGALAFSFSTRPTNGEFLAPRDILYNRFRRNWSRPANR